MPTADAQRLIDALALAPHPEGGHFRRFHEAAIQVEHNGIRRPAMTAIHYLLEPGGRSQWHRVDADEAWHWQQGDALELMQFDVVAEAVTCTRLGPGSDDARMCVVPAGTWQSAHAPGGHALVACVVAPGFAWPGFELLDPVQAPAALRACLATPACPSSD
ncbi:cupin domain-containing protein [Luteimonas aestuarii]|uniref:Cupin domain-containing protein n=1 Tax=Luteimonas aestuarii TaxID=453837 RepID=A0A4R5TYC3_9GAMM|nr:cupin domain-containing protein [Luteimonas aestuarii]TDK26229.1 cupin domain-containing protein [Luteimonas aestuarii]